MTVEGICDLCDGLQGKTIRTKAHELMLPMEGPRVFGPSRAKGYFEQDYRCVRCEAKFTYSTNKNDQTWTLWRG